MSGLACSLRVVALSVLSAKAVLLMSCRPAAAPESGCRVIGADTRVEAVAALYEEHRVPLVVTERSVILCGCGSRRIRGADEASRLRGAIERTAAGGATEVGRFGGAIEAGKLGGAKEAARLGGATEAGKVGGASELSKVAGTTEAGKTGGGTEAGKTGGGVEATAVAGALEVGSMNGAAEELVCTERGTCSGYGLSGSGAIRIFTGRGLVTQPDRCVPDL